MVVFSRIDLLSSYWKGDSSSRGQTVRMVQFLDKFVFQATEANKLAIQIWRHKLMHTSEPRSLLNKKTGKSYRWLLHWGEHLPREQHFTFAETDDSKILNLGLIYLVEDLKEATQKYTSELATSPQLQQNYERVETQLNSYTFS